MNGSLARPFDNWEFWKQVEREEIARELHESSVGSGNKDTNAKRAEPTRRSAALKSFSSKTYSPVLCLEGR